MLSILFLTIFILALLGGVSIFISLLFINSDSWLFYYFLTTGSILILCSPIALWGHFFISKIFKVVKTVKFD
jgi:hypothetical protein